LAAGVGEEEDLSTATHQGHRLMHGGIGGDGEDGGVQATAFREAIHLRRKIGVIGPEDVSRAPFPGELQSRWQEVGGEDVDSAQGEEAGEEQADWPLAGDEDGVAVLEREAVDGFEDGVDWLLHGAFEEGIAPGDFHDAGQDEGHDADIFRVTAAGRLETGGDASALVLGALGEGAMAAGVAMKAGHVMVQGHAVAGPEAARARADADDGPGGLVAENARRWDGPIMDFLDVSGANAAGGDADEEVAGADAGHGKGFEAEVVWAAIDNGAHGFGDGKHEGRLTAKREQENEFMGNRKGNFLQERTEKKEGTNRNWATAKYAKDAKAELTADGRPPTLGGFGGASPRGLKNSRKPPHLLQSVPPRSEGRETRGGDIAARCPCHSSFPRIWHISWFNFPGLLRSVCSC
jgi:hypothetical protein